MYVPIVLYINEFEDIKKFTIFNTNSIWIKLRALKKALEKAKKLKFYRIFLESGIKLTSSFLKENLVNDLKLFISNKKLGTKGHRATNGYLNNFFKKKSYTNEKVNLLGDRLITYKLK